MGIIVDKGGKTRKLRAAMSGAGDITYNHLVAWKRLDDVEVVAISAPSAVRAPARAKEFGIPAVYRDTAEMLDRERPDILDIASPREFHAEHVRLAAARGIDVLCQKPLTNTLAEAERLVDEVEGSIRLMVHDNRRFRSDFRQIGRWIQEDKPGDVLQCQMLMHRSGFLPDKDGRRPAVVRSPAMGTLSRLLIAETLIHQLDVLRYLIGPLRIIAARALRTEADMPGETLATLFMETPAHAPVVLAGSFVAPGLGVVVSDRLELIGTKASIFLEGGELRMLGSEECTLTYDMKKEYQTCFDAAIAHFVECIRTGKPFESDARDNLETLRLVEDAYQAANPDS
jgi:predicted dehydrogenase